jgi:hypothetical protein
VILQNALVGLGPASISSQTTNAFNGAGLLQIEARNLIRGTAVYGAIHIQKCMDALILPYSLFGHVFSFKIITLTCKFVMHFHSLSAVLILMVAALAH